MKFIKQIQFKLHDRSLEKKIGAEKIDRQSLGYHQAKNIGFVYNGSELSERKTIDGFAEELKKAGKKVEHFVFLDQKEREPNFVHNHFCQKDLNWFGKNKSTEASSFTKKKFDLLIAFHNEQPINDLAAQSISHLRIGPKTNKSYCYDLMIDTKSNQTTANFIQNVKTFLNKLKSPIDAKSTL